MKNSKKTAARKNTIGRVFLCFLFLAISTLIGYLVYRKWSHNQEKVIVAAISDFAVLDASKSKSVDTWWLRGIPSMTAETCNLLEFKKQKMAQLIKDHRHLSVDTETIVARYADVLVAGVFLPEGFKYLSTTPGRGKPQGLEIGLCFIPEEAARKFMMYMPSWDGDKDILALLAVDIPDKIMVSILFHELGHALRHNRDTGKIGVNYEPRGSRNNMLEEVEMHKFGDFILNALTEGRYNKFVDKIAKRGLKQKSLSHTIASITLVEQDELNVMFDCQKTEFGKKLLAMQVILSVAFRSCELRHEGIEEQIAAYKHSNDIVIAAAKSADK